MTTVQEDTLDAVVNPFTGKSEPIRRFTIRNSNQVEVQVMTLGATITSIKVPDVNGKVEDVVLGYDNASGYQASNNPYFGATVGRVCNRIANGRFTLDGKEIQLARNFNNNHQLHGGFVGFDKAVWEVAMVYVDGVSMQHRSPDGHEGYPGEVTATVHFTLDKDNSLRVRMEARTTQKTAVNLTNHAYFNLAGHGAGSEALYAHNFMINAQKITETDADSIPTGNFKAVEGTPFDLRKWGNLGDRLQQLLPALGYDDNFCVDMPTDKTNPVARVWHPPSGRCVAILSNQPGVQFYTSNYLPDKAQGQAPVIGKGGAEYVKHGAFCLETQKYPDAVNHPEFPSIILGPGEQYYHEVIYQFSTMPVMNASP